MGAITILPSNIMNKSNKNRRVGNRRANQKQTPKSNANARALIRDHHIGGLGGRVSVPADIDRRIISFNLTQNPPAQVRNLIHWFEVSFLNTTLAISNSVYTEYNLSFALNLLNNYTHFVNLFDQYCIHSVLIEIAVTATANLGTNLGRLTTAIDYDNLTNLGVENNLMEFSTSNTVEVTTGLTVERYVKPTAKTYLTASSASYPAEPQRVWIDSSIASATHYGLRTFWYNNSNSSLSADYMCTYIMGMRNIQ
jgi:hypothetical protein